MELILNKFISRKKKSNEKFCQISIITPHSELPRSEDQTASNTKGSPLQLATSQSRKRTPQIASTQQHEEVELDCVD